jgi:hypothetical protein
MAITGAGRFITYISRSCATPNGHMYMWGENAFNDFLITLQISF